MEILALIVILGRKSSSAQSKYCVHVVASLRSGASTIKWSTALFLDPIPTLDCERESEILYLSFCIAVVLFAPILGNRGEWLLTERATFFNCGRFLPGCLSFPDRMQFRKRSLEYFGVSKLWVMLHLRTGSRSLMNIWNTQYNQNRWLKRCRSWWVKGLEG